MRYLAALVLLCLSFAVHAQGSFTMATQPNGDGTLTPTLTWVTEADACTASGNAAWEGLKSGSGTETLPPIPTSQPVAYALVCSVKGESQALITWTPPTRNTDGTSLTNLAGYRVHWGQSAGVLNEVAQVANPAATSHIVTGLAPGDWFFALRAYTTQGAESMLSNVATKTLRGTVEWSQQTGIKVPEAVVIGVE